MIDPQAAMGTSFFALPTHCKKAIMESDDFGPEIWGGENNPANIPDDAPGPGNSQGTNGGEMPIDPNPTDKPEGGASGEEQGAIPETSDPTSEVDLENNIVTVRDNSVAGFIDASYSSNRRNDLTLTQAFEKVQEGVTEANKILGKKDGKNKCTDFIENKLGLGEGAVDKVKELLANKDIFNVEGRNSPSPKIAGGKEATNQAVYTDQTIYFYRTFFSEGKRIGVTNESGTTYSKNSTTPPQQERSKTNRGQILIHEVLHLIKEGNTDLALANKALGDKKEKFEDTEEGRAKASEYLQDQVEKYCN